MQPIDHMSIGVPYDLSNRINSGARYHLVTTCWLRSLYNFKALGFFLDGSLVDEIGFE
jgi:hypothetical protein